MIANENALQVCTSSLIAVWLTAACSQDPQRGGDGVLFEFALASETQSALEAAPGQTAYPWDCVENPLDQRVQYSYPSGAVEEFSIDRNRQLGLKSKPLELLLTDYDDSIGKPFVALRVLLPAKDLAEAFRFREEYRRCTILVSVNGKPVWVDQNGSRWDGAVPAGAYESEEEARLQLGIGEVAVVWQEWPSLQRSVRFWRWRRAMDLWEYACKEKTRQAVDAEIPDAAELLRSELEGLDCSAPPTLEE